MEFDDILPNVGLSFTPWDSHMFYLSYAEGLSAPRTDNLYAVRAPARRQRRAADAGIRDHQVVRPRLAPQQRDAPSLRWRSTRSTTPNRIVSTFDSDLGFSDDRNVGDVEIQGFDAQIGQRFGERVSLTRLGLVTTTASCSRTFRPCQLPLPLDGKQLVETPEWTYAARMDFDVTENFALGLQGKKVGDRFSTDLNDEVAPGYTVVDLDLNYGFKMPGFEGARAAVQRDQPPRRGILRHHQLGHRRGSTVGGLLSRSVRRAPSSASRRRFDF